MTMTRLLTVVTLAFMIGGFHAGCRGTEVKEEARKASPEYEQEISQWQAKRAEGLTRSSGWLSVVGLSWLSPGENRMGSDPQSAVELPQGKAPAYAGSLFLENGTVRLVPDPSAGILIDGKPATETVLKSDTEDGTTMMTLGPLTLFVIKRADRIGVRVRDSESEAIKEFKGLEYFPVDPAMRVEATFEPYEPVKQIPIANIVGITENQPSPGALVFQLGGETYRLDPITEEGSDELFVIFADQTSGKETYGAGRYMYTDMPKDGKVILDFNQAYNPPCAFTAFATCPLPPAQNRLATRIEAGEKNYGGGK
jgi:hypothetical protein